MLRPHERDALIQALRAGVTPMLGAKHIQVGRNAEMAAMETSLDRIANGGSVFKLVVAHADLNPSRSLHATGGEACSLYAGLMKNLATRVKPDGGALATVIENSSPPPWPRPGKSVRGLKRLNELVAGEDFAIVIAAYWWAYETGNATRWLHGEFTTHNRQAQPLVQIR